MTHDISIFFDPNPSNPFLRTAIFLWLLIKTSSDYLHKIGSRSFFIMPLQTIAFEESNLRIHCPQPNHPCPIFANLSSYLSSVSIDSRNIAANIYLLNKIWNDAGRKMVLRSQQASFFELILIQYILIFFPIVASGDILTNAYGIPIILLFIVFLFWIIITLIACYIDTNPISWYESEKKRIILIFVLWVVFLTYFYIGTNS